MGAPRPAHSRARAADRSAAGHPDQCRHDLHGRPHREREPATWGRLQPARGSAAEGTVNLIGYGRDKARDEATRTNAYARAATPVTAAQVWKAWVRAARYWRGGGGGRGGGEEKLFLFLVGGEREG